MFYYTLWLPVVLAIGFLLKRFRFDGKSIAIILLGLGLCYFHLYQSTINDFSVDVELHRDYIAYIAKHHKIPEANEKTLPSAHHLPSYYLMATAVYELSKAAGDEAPFETVRHLSVLFYGFYLALVALLLRKTLGFNRVYYLALSMAAFWPIGIALGTRLHPDAFGYIGVLGIIYSLMCWGDERKTAALANAFLFCGLLLLVRNFGTYFWIIAFLFLAYALYDKINALREILTPRLIVSTIFSLLCFLISKQHREMLPFTGDGLFSSEYTLGDYVEAFLYFNPWQFASESMLSPTEGSNRIYFWHYVLRTAVLGDFTSWKAWPAVFALGFIWLGIVFYTFYGIARGWRQFIHRDKKQIYVLGLFLGMMVGMLVCARYVYFYMPAISDVRYVFPATALFIVFFAKSIEWHRLAGREKTAQIGQGLGLGFVLLSISIMIAQYLIF